MPPSPALSAPKRKTRVALAPLETGQIWRMADANLHVTLSGKLLVHYKLIKKDVKRTATSLSSKKVIEQFLKKNKAVLTRKRLVDGTSRPA
jgi:hypothetical protein